jgi:hypothetical protein
VEVALLFCVGEGVRLGIRDRVGGGETVTVAVRVEFDVAVAVLLGV